MAIKYVSADEYDRTVALIEERRKLTARLAEVRANKSAKPLAELLAEMRPIQARITEINAII